MPFKTFVAGSVLTASDVNTYLAKQSVIVCTSTTRPSSPPEGMAVYETDTDKLLIYTTATTGWQPPWNLPWGLQANATLATAKTINHSSGNGEILLTVTFTSVARRRYKISGHTSFFSSAANEVQVVPQQNGANLDLGFHEVSGANVDATVAFSTIGGNFATSASTTYDLRVIPVTAATTTTHAAFRSTLIVEDIGPASAPV